MSAEVTGITSVPIVTTKRAGEMLGCSYKTVIRMIEVGDLRAVKGGGKTSPYRVDENSVREYLDGLNSIPVWPDRAHSSSPARSGG